MTAVIQRVSRCALRIDGEVYSEIGQGFLILLGVGEGDNEADCDVLANKIDGLRVFEDENGKMNLSVNDISGSLLIVSNFTLCADVRKGKRPSFTSSARPEIAEPLYERFVQRLSTSTPVKTGVFGADMKIELVNDGPITLVIDSKDLIK